MSRLHIKLSKPQEEFIRNYARLKEKYPLLYIRYQDVTPRGFYYHHVATVDGIKKYIQHDINFYLNNPGDGGDEQLPTRMISTIIKRGWIININHTFNKLDERTMNDGTRANRYLGFILRTDLIEHVLERSK